jgi:hypothetical protein
VWTIAGYMVGRRKHAHDNLGAMNNDATSPVGSGGGYKRCDVPKSPNQSKGREHFHLMQLATFYW